MDNNEEKKDDEVTGPPDQFVGRDLLESYMYYRNFIPSNPYEAYGIKKKCIEFGKELLPTFFDSDEADELDELIKRNEEERDAIDKQSKENKELDRDDWDDESLEDFFVVKDPPDITPEDITDEELIKKNKKERDAIDKQIKKNKDERDAIDKQIEKNKVEQDNTDELYKKACVALKTEIANRREINYEHLIKDHRVYKLTANDADNCEALPKELEIVKNDFINQQHEQHMEKLEEVDNKIFHVLSKTGITPLINPTFENMKTEMKKQFLSDIMEKK